MEPLLRKPGALIVAIASTCSLSACHAVLDPRGPVGHGEKTILIDSLVIMLVIVLPTIMATVIVAWWYRASNTRARYLPTWSFHGGIELVVWGIPFMVVMLLGGVTWLGSHQFDPAKPLQSTNAPLQIEVVSMDWKWLFVYPQQQIASVNRLVIPSGVPVHFSLTSASVMNAFFVPQLGSMIYTMNGMTTHLNLQADEPGIFNGLSAHYSGEGFSDMHFPLQSVSAAQFSRWVATVRGTEPALNVTSYSELVKQGVQLSASTFGSVDPDLFHRITAQALPPGPGPDTLSREPKSVPALRPEQ